MNRKIILLFIIIFAGFLRFYKLDWGNGIFSHPDERNISWAVSNISFPLQMNPKFFAYGGFPIYLYYFTGFFLNKIFPLQNFLSFENIILIGRYWSAFFSTLSVLLFYLLSKKILKNDFALAATFILALLPGAFQQAHFATVESLVTFFFILIIYLSILFWEKKKLSILFAVSIIEGFSIGTKIVSLTFLPIIFLPLFLYFIKPFSIKRLFFLFFNVFFISVLIFISFSVSSPYTFLDYRSFNNSMNYETGVGVGDPITFYTRQFILTTPLIFQLVKIFPYAINPAIEVCAIIGFILLIVNFIRKPSFIYFIIIISFLSYFIPNIIIFAKWTRFMAPVFFFFPLFALYFLSTIKIDMIRKILLFILLVITISWSLAFFTIYQRTDVRLIASSWIEKNIPFTSFLLIESGNVIDIPFSGDYKRTSFDFFHIDQDNKKSEFLSLIAESDYFVIQSRRVWANYTRMPDTHPTTAKFYPLLWSGNLGFKKIAEFDSFPKIFNIKINDEYAEETFTVFDHPHITIWKKINYYPKEYYLNLFEIKK